MVQPFTIFYHFTIFDREGVPFGYLLLINGALYLLIICNMFFAPGGGSPLYRLYRYVPHQRLCFF